MLAGFIHPGCCLPKSEGLNPGYFLDHAQLGAGLWAASLHPSRMYFSATGEREMFLKIEKRKHKTRRLRTYVSLHLAPDCFEVNEN